MRTLLVLILLFTQLSGFSQLILSAVQQEGCAPFGVVITVAAPSPSEISSYAWEITLPDGQSLKATSASYTNIFTIDGSYDVKLTINGTSTVLMEGFIVVHALPAADFSINTLQGCPPLCVSFNDLSQSAGNLTQWNWDFGNGQTSSLSNPTFCYNSPGLYRPVLSIVNEFGCYDDITLSGSIEVLDLFQETQISASSTLDCGLPVPISFSHQTVGTGTLSYAWTFGDGQFSALDADTVVCEYQQIGKFRACLEVTNELGCKAGDCVNLEIFDVLEPLFSIDTDSSCVGSEVGFQNLTQPSPSLVQWDIDGDGITDGEGTYYVGDFASEGIYTGSVLSYFSPRCQVTSALPPMRVMAPLDVQVSGIHTSCVIPFDMHLKAAVDGPGVYSYNWYVDGIWAGDAAELDMRFDNYGMHDLRLEVQNDFGCSVVWEKPAYVKVQAFAATLTYPANLCLSSPFSLDSVTYNSVSPIAFWRWDVDGDGITDFTGENPVYYFPASGNYSPVVQVEDSSGCLTDFVLPNPIFVQDSLYTEIFVSDSLVCAGEPPQFCIDKVDGANYLWDFGDGKKWPISDANILCVQHDYSDTGYFDIGLRVFNDVCQATFTKPKGIYVQGPLARFETNVTCGQWFDYDFTQYSVGADSLVWDFGDGSPNVSGIENPSHHYEVAGHYWVSLTVYSNSSDCPPDVARTLISTYPPETDFNFSQTSGCPPLEVKVSPPEFHPYWLLVFSNGHRIEATWAETKERWEVDYVHDGISEQFEAEKEEDFWPLMEFSEFGLFDLSVTTLDEYGCSHSANYSGVVDVISEADFADFKLEYIVKTCDEIQVRYVPLSSDLLSWAWQFENQVTSSDSLPVITYYPPFQSTYNSSLSATNKVGCSSTSALSMLVPGDVEAKFEIIAGPPCTGVDRRFANFSSGDISSFLWDFGGDPSDPNNFSTSANPSHVYKDNGLFSPCLTVYNSLGCSQTYCLDDAVLVESPKADFTYESQIENCLYTVAFENLTSGNVSCEKWNFGDGQKGFSPDPTHSYPIGVYDVKLMVCNDLGCRDSAIVTDILNYGNDIGPFEIRLSADSCLPFEVGLEAYNPQEIKYQYFWQFDDGFGDSENNASTTHYYEQPGAFCPSLIMTDLNGCPILLSCPEQINVRGVQMTLQGDGALCRGDSIAFEITGASQIDWNPHEDIHQVADDFFWLSPDSSSAFYFEADYFSSCVLDTLIYIKVNPLPNPTLDLPFALCDNQGNWTLSEGKPFGGTYYFDNQVIEMFDLKRTEGYYALAYVYTDSLGCAARARDSIFIHATTPVDFILPENICEDYGLLVLNSGVPSGGTYSLNGQIMTDFDTSQGTGRYPFIYSLGNANGCLSSDTAVVEVRPLPEIHYTIENPCSGQGLIVSNQSTIESGNIAEVLWDFGVSGVFETWKPPVLTFDNPGVYPLDIHMLSDWNCESFQELELEIFAAPLAEYSWTGQCQLDSLFFHNQSTSLSPILSQQWRGSWSADHTDHLGVLPPAPGDYEVQLRVVNSDFCADSISHIVHVYPMPEVSVYVPDVCLGEQTASNNTTVISAGSISTYVWDLLWDGSQSVSKEVNLELDQAGAYPYRLTAISEQGCAAMIADTVKIFPLPEAFFALAPFHPCAGSAILAEDASTMPDATKIAAWFWQVNGVEATGQNTLLFDVDQAGDYQLSLRVKSDRGCEDLYVYPDPLTIHPKPMAGFTVQTDPVQADPEVIIEDLSQQVQLWRYDFGDGQTSDESAPLHRYAAYGQFEIQQIVWNSFGCSDTAYQYFSVNPQILLYVPNSFTPNRDGINEVFLPILDGFSVREYHLQIFNRWGVLIFESKDPAIGWDGRVGANALVAQEGIYAWRLKVSSAEGVEAKELQGHVSLLP